MILPQFKKNIRLLVWIIHLCIDTLLKRDGISKYLNEAAINSKLGLCRIQLLLKINLRSEHAMLKKNIFFITGTYSQTQQENWEKQININCVKRFRYFFFLSKINVTSWL